MVPLRPGRNVAIQWARPGERAALPTVHDHRSVTLPRSLQSLWTSRVPTHSLLQHPFSRLPRATGQSRCLQPPQTATGPPRSPFAQQHAESYPPSIGWQWRLPWLLLVVVGLPCFTLGGATSLEYRWRLSQPSDSQFSRASGGKVASRSDLSLCNLRNHAACN